MTKVLRISLCTDDVEVYLGADFIRAFRSVHDPDTDQLCIRVADKTVGLEVTCIGTENTHLASLGLEDMSEDQTRQLNEIVAKEIGETADRPLGCTNSSIK